MRSSLLGIKSEKRRPRQKPESAPYPRHDSTPPELRETLLSIQQILADLPDADNEPGAVEKMLRANTILRNLPWPAPFDLTTHRLDLGDARQLEVIPALVSSERR
jgi:hypothetical protein